MNCRCFVFYDQYNLGQMLLQPMLQLFSRFMASYSTNVGVIICAI